MTSKIIAVLPNTKVISNNYIVALFYTVQLNLNLKHACG